MSYLAIRKYVETVGVITLRVQDVSILISTTVSLALCNLVLKSVTLNSLSLITIYTFDMIIVPLLTRSTQENWLHRNIGSIYQIIFQLPVVGMSLYLNVRSRQLIPPSAFMLNYFSRVLGVQL